MTSGTRDIQDAKAKPLAAKTVAVPFLARVTGYGAVLPGVDMQILTFDRLAARRQAALARNDSRFERYVIK